MVDGSVRVYFRPKTKLIFLFLLEMNCKINSHGDCYAKPEEILRNVHNLIFNRYHY